MLLLKRRDELFLKNNTLHDMHLSVVATSRNDDHGENLLQRMQAFVDGFILQCKRHRLRAELILVEWNPPADKKPLAQALNFPADKGPCVVRIITVPPELHATLKHADGLPLFQMIAKNVGIRRARGRYVLATNIDILFSDSIMSFMRDKLKPKKLYRVDRIDVPAQTKSYENFDETLRYCDRHQLRISAKVGTCYQVDGQWKCFYKERRKYRLNLLRELLFPFYRKQEVKTSTQQSSMFPTNQRPKITFAYIIKKIITKRYHMNACGDFTLLARDDWFALRGYPEWPMYSMHLDSILLYQAFNSGIKEIDLPRHTPIYHIDHSMGSGYTPEGSDQLFARLRAKGVPYLLDWSDILNMAKEMKTLKKQGKPVLYNGDSWGFSDRVFEETVV